ncbi:hypothetical protein NE575_19240, partial [Clostridium sp. SL.3.18]|nr:hypothetical protein [Clostridium sp. SL.3.18]
EGVRVALENGVDTIDLKFLHFSDNLIILSRKKMTIAAAKSNIHAAISMKSIKKEPVFLSKTSSYSL